MIGLGAERDGLPLQLVGGSAQAVEAGPTEFEQLAGHALRVTGLQRQLQSRGVPIQRGGVVTGSGVFDSGVGGLTEAKRIATLALAQNLRLAPHVWGGGVGLATACHLIASLPASPHTEHPPYPQMLEYDMSDNALRTQLLKTPLRLEAGHVLLPEGPGLGVELDPAAVERYRIC